MWHSSCCTFEFSLFENNSAVGFNRISELLLHNKWPKNLVAWNTIIYYLTISKGQESPGVSWVVLAHRLSQFVVAM